MHNIVRFYKKHIRLDKFTGFPLTLAILLAVGSLIFFFAIAGGVLLKEDIVEIDIVLTAWLFAWRNPFVTDFFLFITTLGRVDLLFFFLIIVSVLLLQWRKQRYIAPFWLCYVGTVSAIGVVKMILQRPRPTGDIPVYLELSFSFPSAHAAGALAFYGFLLYILLKNVASKKMRSILAFAHIGLILLIGFSRLYLGVHFLSDVLGGYMIALCLLSFSIALQERRLKEAR